MAKAWSSRWPIYGKISGQLMAGTDLTRSMPAALKPAPAGIVDESGD